MSGCAGFSKGRIQFKPNNSQGAELDYSDRSLIEIRQHDVGNYSLKALDIENNNTEIFNIPLENDRNQYKYGNSVNDPDEIRANSGIYRLWLNKDSRDSYHKDIRKCFAEINFLNPLNSYSEKSDSDTDSEYDKPGPRIKSSESIESERSDVSKPKTFSSDISPRDLITDIHLLSKYIEQGDAKEAAKKASSLASSGARLQSKGSKRIKNDQEFTIQVQIDGNEYGVEQQGPNTLVDVFQSTTIRELRALFELTYQYPPPNQYFFVNSRLAHDKSTMKELDVGPNSLFILFLLTHPKTGASK